MTATTKTQARIMTAWLVAVERERRATKKRLEAQDRATKAGVTTDYLSYVIGPRQWFEAPTETFLAPTIRENSRPFERDGDIKLYAVPAPHVGLIEK